MRTKVWTAIAAGLLCGAAGCNMWDKNDDRPADTNESTGRSQSTWSGDETFVRETAQSGQMEVEMARLGIDRAQDEQVRQFAQTLVNDHTKVNQELKDIATGQRITVPTDAPRTARSHVDELSRLTGQEFDRKFISLMVEGHQKSIQRFEQESRSGRNGAVREFATRTLPTLRDHLSRAQELQQRLGGRASGTGTQNHNMR